MLLEISQVRIFHSARIIIMMVFEIRRIGFLAAFVLAECVLMSGCGSGSLTSGGRETEEKNCGYGDETVENTQADTEESIKETEKMMEVLDPKERYLSKMSGTDQMIFVIGNGSSYGAVLSYYERTEEGWTEILETPAQIGQNGFNAHTVEDDMTTPTGCFDLGIAFGNQPNPGTVLPWVDVNPYLYWIDDLESDYYNLLIDSREVPDGWFLHCYGNNPYTLGCVAIEETQVVTLLQRLKPGAKIVISSSGEALASLTES